MATKPPRIELTFGKNDEDLYNWIVKQGVSNATLVKRILRDAMNGIPTNQPTNEPTFERLKETMIEPTKEITIESKIETINEPTKEFAFMDKMKNSSGGMDF